LVAGAAAPSEGGGLAATRGEQARRWCAARSGCVFFGAPALSQSPREHEPIERPLIVGKHMVRAARPHASPP